MLGHELYNMSGGYFGEKFDSPYEQRDVTEFFLTSRWYHMKKSLLKCTSIMLQNATPPATKAQGGGLETLCEGRCKVQKTDKRAACHIALNCTSRHHDPCTSASQCGPESSSDSPSGFLRRDSKHRPSIHRGATAGLRGITVSHTGTSQPVKNDSCQHTHRKRDRGFF